MVHVQCCTYSWWLRGSGPRKMRGLVPTTFIPSLDLAQSSLQWGLPASCLVHPNPSLCQSSEWLFKDANLAIWLLEQLMGRRLDSKLLQIFPYLVPSLVPLLTLRTPVFIFLSFSGQLQVAIPLLAVLLPFFLYLDICSLLKIQSNTYLALG